MDPRIISIVVASAFLFVPGAAADHPDHECWGMDGATKCFQEDLKDGDPAATGNFARRVCDEMTGQACTSP